MMHRIALGLALSFATQNTTLQRPRPVTTQEHVSAEKALNLSLIHDYNDDLTFAPDQEFAIPTPKGIVVMVPVGYVNHPDGSGTSLRCGIFFLQLTGPQLYIETVGAGIAAHLECGGLDGIGFEPAAPGQAPRVLVLSYGHSPSFSFKVPDVFDWDAAKANYLLNDDLTEKLGKDPKIKDIATMKRKLAALKSRSAAPAK